MTKDRPVDEREHALLALQVALDRAGFSPGEIDASMGDNTRNALAAFAASRGVAPNANDPATRSQLGPALDRPLVEYALTAEDLSGPFVEAIPDDLVEQSRLPALAYRTPLELVSEKFHVSPVLLQRLNPQADWEVGSTLTVPDVEPFVPPTKTMKRPSRPNGTEPGLITVSGRGHSLVVTDDRGTVVFFAPVTVGGEHDPLPVGEWKVTGVFDAPVFNYNPALFWDADPVHSKARIAAGPNNPVGVVWIDLDKEHYGFHGTPEPSRVGHTQSHGCIRLTNWDAARLASLVRDGQRVILQ